MNPILTMALAEDNFKSIDKANIAQFKTKQIMEKHPIDFNTYPEVVINFIDKGEYGACVVLAPTIYAALHKYNEQTGREMTSVLSAFIRNNERGF